MANIKLLENDGHNELLYHIFRDWKQAQQYLRLGDHRT